MGHPALTHRCYTSSCRVWRRCVHQKDFIFDIGVTGRLTDSADVQPTHNKLFRCGVLRLFLWLFIFSFFEICVSSSLILLWISVLTKCVKSIWKADSRLAGQVARVLRIVNFCHSSLSLFTCHTKGFPGVYLYIRIAIAITNSSFHCTFRCQHIVVGIVTTLLAEHSRNRGSIPSRGQRFFSSTHLLTYSMERSPPWEANRFSASQEIPCILWNP
jgi:hypothetical protein